MNQNLDFKFEESIKKATNRLMEIPCQVCGKPLTLSDIARAVGLDKAGLWRFMGKSETTMMPYNLRKLAEFLEARGVKVPVKAPSIARQAKGNGSTGK